MNEMRYDVPFFTRFEVLTAMCTMIQIFWDVMPSQLVNSKESRIVVANGFFMLNSVLVVGDKKKYVEHL